MYDWGSAHNLGGSRYKTETACLSPCTDRRPASFELIKGLLNFPQIEQAFAVIAEQVVGTQALKLSEDLILINSQPIDL